MSAELLVKANALQRDPKTLSVLIPTLYTRWDALKRLLDDLHGQIGERTNIEVLAMLDMKTMPLGTKRNKLIAAAQGDYIVFLNDDDEIADNWVETVDRYIRSNHGTDVFSIRAECCQRKTPESKWGIVWNMATSLQCKPYGTYIDLAIGTVFLHRPAMWCIWKREIAASAQFPAKNYGEDTEWMEQVCANAKTEVVIPQVLYRYYADDRTSECGMWRYEKRFDPTPPADLPASVTAMYPLLRHLRLPIPTNPGNYRMELQGDNQVTPLGESA